MWYSAKHRAKAKGLVFDIKPEDIKIPDTCPLLDIPIKKNKGTLCDTSPTLDRLDPLVGYTIDNIWVISYKANRCKSNLTLEELVTMTENLKRKIEVK